MWGYKYGIKIVQPPYGLLHVTCLSTAKTLPIAPAVFTPEIVIPPNRTRIGVVRMPNGKKVLWAELYDDDLDEYISRMHQRAGVTRLPNPPHMTLAYKVPPDFKYPVEGLPFNIVLHKQIVGGFNRAHDKY